MREAGTILYRKSGEISEKVTLKSMRFSWSPLSDQKGFKPTVEFGERTRDCSPGHARKEGRHVAKMGASRGFSLSVAPVFGFSRGMTGSSGSLSCGAREVRAS